MRIDRKVGLALASLACALGVAAWMQSTRDAGDRSHRGVATTQASAPIAVPADIAFESPKPFAIDAAVARAAVRDGTLRIALPDGRVHAIAIERTYTDETGHWNIVGRAPTRLGAQAMVLTFGANSVFGRIPLPDGGALHVVTAPGDRIVVAPDGGIVPPRFAQVPGQTDVVAPPRGRLATHAPPPTTAPTPGAATTPTIAASKPLRIDTTTRSSPGVSSAPPASASANVDTTPVTVDLITAYTPEQIALRGTGAAVYTEIANLVAITNQAHIDSGSRVRIRTVKVIALGAPPQASNTSVLDAVGFGESVAGVSLEALRDQYAGDLVTVLRPHLENDGTCGVGFTPGPAYGRTIAWARFGYSVINVDGPCGTLVHAHELGHNLGSMHDRETDTSQGITMHGAYVFSSGFRTPAFATVMAYLDGSLEQQWIGRFSNPLQHDCAGVACGIADYSDNTRSLNLMAKAIAAFRGPPGTLSIGDIEAIEPNYAMSYVTIPVRLSGVATTDDLMLQMQVVGGTATQGVDYDVNGALAPIPRGQREGAFQVRVFPDAAAEADETILVRFVAPDGIVVDDAEAVVTIVEDDPRTAIAGNVWFPSGYAPNSPIGLQVDGIDGPGSSIGLLLYPPDFRYKLFAPRGMQVQLRADVADPMVLAPLTINEVRRSMEHHLFAEPGVRLSGRLRAIPGMVLPTAPVQVDFLQVYRNQPTYPSLTLSPPDFAYSLRVPASSNVRFEIAGFHQPGNVEAFAAYAGNLNDVRSDRTFDLVLSNLPSLRVCCDWIMPEPYAPDIGNVMGMSVLLSAPAPAGGVALRYRTVDGTAKAGKDYGAVSGTVTIPAGELRAELPTISLVYGAEHEGPEYFDVVIDQVTGAQATKPAVRIHVNPDRLRTGGPLKRQAQ